MNSKTLLLIFIFFTIQVVYAVPLSETPETPLNTGGPLTGDIILPGNVTTSITTTTTAATTTIAGPGAGASVTTALATTLTTVMTTVVTTTPTTAPVATTTIPTTAMTTIPVKPLEMPTVENWMIIGIAGVVITVIIIIILLLARRHPTPIIPSITGFLCFCFFKFVRKIRGYRIEV